MGLLWFLPGTSGVAAQNNFELDAELAPSASFKPGAPWQELRPRLPSWPEDKDLVEFVPDGPSTAFRYFIDQRSLRTDPDHVVRYTLVAQTPGGSRNYAFEGIRCTPNGAFKIYALGIGGRFEPLGDSDWQPISAMAGERYREDLWRFHLCVPLAFKPRPKVDMLRSLQGRLPARQNMEFMPD